MVFSTDWARLRTAVTTSFWSTLPLLKASRTPAHERVSCRSAKRGDGRRTLSSSLEGQTAVSIASDGVTAGDFRLSLDDSVASGGERLLEEGKVNVCEAEVSNARGRFAEWPPYERRGRLRS